MLNLYDTEAINLTVTLLFCSNVLHNFTKNAYVSQNFLLIICELFIFSNAANTIVKLFDTLKIKTNSNNLLLGIFFFFFAFWAHHQHTKDCWKLCNVASKQEYPLICVIRDTGYSRYSFIIFCKVLLIFAKKNAIVSKILGYMRNLYKFSETVYYDCEVAYQIWRLHQFLFKYKIRKKRFSTPLEFNRKMVNLSEKTNTSIIVIKVSQQPIKYFNEYYKIMFPQW